MGVLRWLDRIDPDRWREATDRISAEDLLSPDRARRFLEDFGKVAEPDLLESVAEAEADEDSRASALNQLLESAVADEVWELDKALTRLEDVALVLPGARPLLKITAFGGIDIKVPARCVSDGGLVGCCSPAILTDCVESLTTYGSIEAVRRAADNGSRGILAFLTGRRSKVAAAGAVLADGWYWDRWLALRSAVLTCAKKGHLLGLGIST